MRLYLKIEKISCQWLVICFRRALEVDPMLVPASKQFRSTALQCTCASKIWKRKDGSCCTSQASKVSSCFTETSLKIALAAWMWQKRTAIALFRDCLSFCISGCGWQIEDLFQYKDTYMYIYIYILYIYIYLFVPVPVVNSFGSWMRFRFTVPLTFPVAGYRWLLLYCDAWSAIYRSLRMHINHMEL